MKAFKGSYKTLVGGRPGFVGSPTWAGHGAHPLASIGTIVGKSMMIVDQCSSEYKKVYRMGMKINNETSMYFPELYIILNKKCKLECI